MLLAKQEERESDFVKSFPFANLQNASGLNLLGGGVQLVAALWLVWQDNMTDWEVNTWFYVLLLVGAVIMGAVGAVVNMYDSHLRTKMAIRSLELTGSTDPAAAAEMAKAFAKMSEGGVIQLSFGKSSLAPAQN